MVRRDFLTEMTTVESSETRGSISGFIGGRGALFTNPDPLASEPYLVIANLDGGTQWARIDLAAPITITKIETHYTGEISQTETVSWDEQAQAA